MMKQIFRKRHTKVGARPGTLVVDESAGKPKIDVIQFSSERVTEEKDVDVERLPGFLEGESRVWIDVRGLGHEPTLVRLGEIFSLHLLTLEQIVNVPQRPTVDIHGDYLLIITRMVMEQLDGEIETEQVSILVGKNVLITFQEHDGDVFEPVRQRLRQPALAIRSRGTDYLAYAIVDAVVDGYFPVLEAFGEKLQILEDTIVDDPHPDTIRDIHKIKRELLALRRGIWPKRESLGKLLREYDDVFTEETKIYLRDCYDHCVQIIDIVESCRDIAGGLMDVYMSSLGVRQNEVMKVLTIMASIFVPLTFLAGIYGMNFSNMPELNSRWGYPVLLSVMAAVGLGMTWFFYSKGWIGNSGPRRRRREEGADG